MLAFTFPGQGSQKPAMGSAWVDHPSFELAHLAADILSRDIPGLLLHADEGELKQTENSQTATFVLSLVVLDAIERLGLEPTMVAGHSLGEYTALTAAGALSFEDGVRLVGERSAAMADAAYNQPGSMTALLGISDEDAQIACNMAEGNVWLANMNSPGQVVVSGDEDTLKKVAELAKQMGAKKVIPLPVSGAFHSPFMESARERLRKALAEVSFRNASPEVVTNIDAKPHFKAEEWPRVLSAQLCSPVRWHQSLTELYSRGMRTFIEIGPGSVLTGLAKKTLQNTDEPILALNVSIPSDLENLLERLSGQQITEKNANPSLYTMTERLVVSPGVGRFKAAEHLLETLPKLTQDENHLIEISAGDLIGWSGEQEIRTPFSGILHGILVLEGERLVAGQPVAWLRSTDV